MGYNPNNKKECFIMARVPQVTRTIQTTKATVLCMDIENREPVNIDIVLPRTYKDEASMMKAAKNAIENDAIKCVQIVAHTVEETLYGMSEQKFIELATILPPRKDYTANAEAETEN